MTIDKLAALKELGRRQTDENTRTRQDARRFMIRTGVYTKKGELKKVYGGGATKEPAEA